MIRFALKDFGPYNSVFAQRCALIANEAADPRGSAVELANHRAVREYRRKISSQRKGLF